MNIRLFRYGLWAIIAILCFFLIPIFLSSKFNVADQAVNLGAPFYLIDQNDQPITEKAFLGHPTILFFGFTHCPDVCPTTLYELVALFKELGNESKDLQAFFITVDPERDRSQIMKAYMSHFTNHITGITGDPMEIAKLIASWKIYVKKVPFDNGDYTIDHTASLFLLDRNGRFKGTITYEEDSKVALEKLHRLISGS